MMREYGGLQRQWAELERQEREEAMLQKLRSIADTQSSDDIPPWWLGYGTVGMIILWVFALLGLWHSIEPACSQTLTLPEAKQLEAGMPTSVRSEALEDCDEVFPSIYECVVTERGVIHFRKSVRTGRGVLLYVPFPRLKPDDMQ